MKQHDTMALYHPREMIVSIALSLILSVSGNIHFTSSLLIIHLSAA